MFDYLTFCQSKLIPVLLAEEKGKKREKKGKKIKRNQAASEQTRVY
jgi:hypothetical protein